MDDGSNSLVPFAPANGSMVAGWALTREEIEAWCGLKQDAVADAQVEAWSAPDDVLAFVFCHGGTAVGYGELWVDDEEGEVELGHLIVDPAHRNRSFGQQMVKALTETALTYHRLVVLRVRRENRAAIGCYLGSGFVPVSPEEEAEWNAGQPHNYQWMVAKAD